MVNNNITWIGEKKTTDPMFADQIFELPSDDNSLIGFAVGIALQGSHTVLDLPSIYSLPEVMLHLQKCDFSNTNPVHSLTYRSNNTAEDRSHEFPLSLVVRIPISNADNIGPILEQCSSIKSNNIEVWMSSNDTVKSHISRSRRSSPLILLQYMSNSQSMLSTVSSKPLLRKDKKVEKTKSLISIFVSPSSFTLCESILQEIGEDILQQSGWDPEDYGFELIVLQQLQPLPLDEIKEIMDDTGRGIFVDILSSAFQVCIEGSFWRLEAQPQQMFLGHLSYQKAKRALARSLLLQLER